MHNVQQKWLERNSKTHSDEMDLPFWAAPAPRRHTDGFPYHSRAGKSCVSRRAAACLRGLRAVHDRELHSHMKDWVCHPMLCWTSSSGMSLGTLVAK